MALKINGEVIPNEAIEFELKRLIMFYARHMPPEQVRQQTDILRQRAKEQAIGAKLLMNEAARLDIRVTAEDIETKLKELKKSLGGEKAFQEMIRKQGLSEDALRTSIERGRKVDLLVEQIVQGVEEPTEDELKAHYKEHASEYVKADMAQVQHILIRPESQGEADVATARSRLQEIRERIKEGVEFADEAAAYSDCPSGKRSGGSLGWLTKGTMVPAVDQVVFAMKDGDVSDILETELGLHIMKRNGFEKGGPAAYPEVAETIRDFLRHARRGALLASYVEDLKKKAVIEDN